MRLSHIPALSLALAILGGPAFAWAADQSGSEAAAPDSAAQQPQGPSAEETAEKEIRKVCKLKVCSILDSKDPNGEDIACDIVRTWRAEEIAQKLEKRIDWPWGKARCEAQVKLKREPLAKAMSEAAYEVALPSQTIRCMLDQKAGGTPYKVEIALSPKVKFENGKATEAQVNWGTVSAPMLVYPILYAGTALDNANNVLGPEVVRIVNNFTTKECPKLTNEGPPKPN